MRLIRPATELIESIYRVDQSAPSWLANIRAVAEQCSDNHAGLGVCVYNFTINAEGRFECEHFAGDPEIEPQCRKSHRLAGPEAIRNVYLRRPVITLTRALAGYEHDLGRLATVESGLHHNVIAIGLDGSGRGSALCFLQVKPVVLTRAARSTLARVAAHLASARRLVSHASGTSSSADEEAVLNADGLVVHAVREARDAGARCQLQEAARRIDRARLRNAPSGDENSSLWNVLVDGKWSLVERFEADGRRVFVARRNDPTVRRSRVLRENERKVVALLALGHSMKLCSYELGFAQSTVSELASSALRKLGLTTRAELIAMHGAIVQPEHRGAAPSDN